MILAPATATWAPRSLFLVHRNGDTAAGFARLWRPLVDEGWTLIVPQSSRACPDSGCCWEDTEVALRELRGHIEECRRKRGLPTEGMIVAGACQGAGLALAIAGEAGLPWLCVTPSLPASFDARPLTAVPSRTKGAFILAEGDRRDDGVRALIRELESSGVDVTIRVVDGAGDDLPRDFASIASVMLRPLIGDPAVP
jgi:hypothetical protein